MNSSCVIFDFDGVIADTERLHLAAYNHAFAESVGELGKVLEIPAETYFGRYIVYGNREGFWHMLRDAGLGNDKERIDRLCVIKDRLFDEQLHHFAEPLPGIRPLLAWLEEKGVPRAICSGAQRKEIEHLLEGFGIAGHFDLMVTIEDVRMGKPDPEGYNKAFQMMHEKYDANLDKKKSLVIEDSAGGCAAGRAAGIPVLGVATSLSLKDVSRCANHAVERLDQLDMDELARWLGI